MIIPGKKPSSAVELPDDSQLPTTEEAEILAAVASNKLTVDEAEEQLKQLRRKRQLYDSGVGCAY